jgi:hypothetical protein
MDIFDTITEAKDDGNSGRGGLTPEVFAEETKEQEEAGFEVIFGDPKHLLLDLDTDRDLNSYDNRSDDLLRMFGHFEIERYTSKSGRGWHVIVRLDEPIPNVLERIALQAALGSDPKREALSILRVRNGIAEPIRLFKPKTPVERKPPKKTIAQSETEF